MPKPVALIVDDHPSVLDVVSKVAVGAGFDVRTYAAGREAIDSLRARKPHIALVDVKLPDVGGIEVLKAIRHLEPQCRVVIMSGGTAVDTAVEAIKLGAIDFLSKPFDFKRLRQTLDAERVEIERRRQLVTLQNCLAAELGFCGMIGRSARMQDVFSLIRRAAPHARTALVTGETGTGKELVARALHMLGPRRSGPYVTINCSALVESLFETELFGHRRGAFTGAVDNKVGLFEQADGGTLFLDELGELPLALQAKLLRVLETGETQRVGDVASRKVDVRVIAATNRSLREEIDAGRFRRDLYYRLNVIEIPLPPLRDRRDDIPWLVAAFVRTCAARLGKPIVGTTSRAEDILVSSAWDGNVRELRNVIERACILAETEFITERELMTGSRAQRYSHHQVQGAPGVDTTTAVQPLIELERAHVRNVMEDVGGNKSAAAVRLGLSRRALYRRLDRLGLAAGASS